MPRAAHGAARDADVRDQIADLLSTIGPAELMRLAGEIAQQREERSLKSG